MGTPKNPAAVELGRKGGQARAALPPDELSRIGRMGGRPRLPRCPVCGRTERKCGCADPSRKMSR